MLCMVFITVHFPVPPKPKFVELYFPNATKIDASSKNNSSWSSAIFHSRNELLPEILSTALSVLVDVVLKMMSYVE